MMSHIFQTHNCIKWYLKVCNVIYISKEIITFQVHKFTVNFDKCRDEETQVYEAGEIVFTSMQYATDAYIQCSMRVEYGLIFAHLLLSILDTFQCGIFYCHIINDLA